MRGAEDEAKYMVANGRWIPEKDDNGQAYLSLRYLLTEDISAGLDYRPLTDDVGFLANWRAVSESENLPALVFGTSTDDFEDDGREVTSQTFSALLSKRLLSLQEVHIAPYGGAAWIHEVDELRAIGGVNFVWQDLSTLIQYSGTDTHLTVGYTWKSATLSFVYWGLKYPGMALTMRY